MRRRESEIDRDIAALLAARAFTEIRHLAGGSARLESGDSPEETLERIRFLANLGHNLPGVARPRPAMRSRLGAGPGSWEQATAARPMTGVWSTVGPKGQAWILRHIGQEGRTWTPPPALPERRKGPSPMTPRQWAGFLLWRWPVRAPVGRQPLPAEANVLKALDTETVCALYDEARRQQLRLAHRVRSTERDAYLWGRDHKAECAPEFCGYVPEAADKASPTAR